MAWLPENSPNTPRELVIIGLPINGVKNFEPSIYRRKQAHIWCLESRHPGKIVGTDAFHIIQSLGVNNRHGFGGPKNKGWQIENDEPQKQLYSITCPIPYWLVNRDYNKRLQESTTPGFLRGLNLFRQPTNPIRRDYPILNSIHCRSVIIHPLICMLADSYSVSPFNFRIVILAFAKTHQSNNKKANNFHQDSLVHLCKTQGPLLQRVPLLPTKASAPGSVIFGAHWTSEKSIVSNLKVLVNKYVYLHTFVYIIIGIV